MNRATVITDASHCQRTKAGGWAAWVRLPWSDEPIKMHGPIRRSVSHSWMAEMIAAVNGVWIAHKAGARQVLIQTDCMLVVQAVNRDIKSKKARPYWLRKLREAGLPKELLIEARHVKGHTKINAPRFYVNRWCDEHAKREMRQQRKEKKA